MAAFFEGSWFAADGLRLHYRDYAPREEHARRPPILCLPGLTRNARDFDMLAARLAGEWRLICPDLRGRGASAHAKDAASYVPAVYLADTEALLAALGVRRVVAFGTSLGGLLTMLLAAGGAGRIAGALLNDIGPDVEGAGLVRIRGYVGRGGSYPTWLHAARAMAETHRAAYPDYALDDWLAMAKRLCRLTPQGRIVPDYDVRIAEPMKAPPADSIDMWPAFDALAAVPLLIVRGGLSDILSAATAEAMRVRHPDAEVMTLPRIGHAPTLDEPEARAGIARLLARIT